MINAKSSTNSASDDRGAKTESIVAAPKAEQTFDQSTHAVERRRINRRMVQNVRLIWLDSNIDENDADCRDTMAQLRRTVNTIDMYTDGAQCIEFVKRMENEKACMVISNYLG
jgi:hypothetical protein